MLNLMPFMAVLSGNDDMARLPQILTDRTGVASHV